ncbi:MAG: UbiD family decarboxylase [Gammaproteobacteria bacterium]|nr:UbiD family decarboxylase [Gammaproteobacteria bacterium]
MPAADKTNRDGPTPPFDSLRDWVAALDAHGLLLTIDRIDQDAYHATGLVYAANDRCGWYDVPALRFEEVKIDGRWVRGPLLGLLQSNLLCDAILFGQVVDRDDSRRSYRAARDHLIGVLERHQGTYPQIPPVTVAREQAPCKEVVLRGGEIDLQRYAFIRTNPADSARYITTASHFMVDPELGPNFGTYRCEIKGPRLLGVNPEPNQTGWKMLRAAQARGEKSVKYSIVIGQDPVVWFISSTRVANRFGNKPVDELALAGGFRGRPMEVVKSETSDILVPAHAEMVIEGEVPLDRPGLPEGPFGEMFGYLGPRKAENYFMNVTAVTHRREPWIVNVFTGAQRGMIMAPQDALTACFLRQAVPGFVDMHQPQDTPGIAVMSIDKTGPGQGLEAGRRVAQRSPIAKVVIVVDKDIDVLDRQQVMFALGSRWQPHPAAEIIRDVDGLITDPSQPVQGRTSKIVIDATRQLAGEGGRERFPDTNRALLGQGAPGALAEAETLFGARLRTWQRGG